MTDLISRRLRAARERADLTQAELSKRLGFNDRQTVTAIETGQRKMSADELLKAVEVLNLDLGYFTDEFRADGEARFSWRADADVDPESLHQFESTAGQWIATYRKLGERLGVQPSALQYVLPLTTRSSFEDAQTAAERICVEWELGGAPALKLENAITTNIGALVLNVDTPHGISGAACRMPNLRAIFINRQEIPGRRNFNMAHELFHLLTWDTMPPAYTDSIRLDNSQKQFKRIEQLAQNFAAAVLMPEYAIREQWELHGGHAINTWFNKVSEYFCVTEEALRWRTVNLVWLALEFKDALKSYRTAVISVLSQKHKTPERYSKIFMERFSAGLSNGCLSVRRAAQILGVTIDELANLFNSYELAVPFDL